MTEKRETIIAPLGYQTTPNQYGVFPEGALALAENVCLRNKGKLLTVPGIGTPVTVGSTATQKTYALAPLDSGHVYAFVNDSSGNTWTVSESGNSAAVPSSLSATNLFPYARTSPVRSRDRMLVNSNSGVLTGDSMAPSSAGTRALRRAGLFQPSFAFSNTTTGTGFPIPAGIAVGYCCVLTREYADGYVLKSVPSPGIVWINNNTVNYKLSLISNFNGTDIQVGDFLEVYRTDGLVTTTVNADPGTTYKLIIRYAITAADIIAGSVTLVDQTVMLAPFYSTTGKQLYTNPFQEGSTGANRQPEINGAQAVYKGFAFFGNITERPQATFSVPGGVWDSTATSTAVSASNRANGIGTFTGSGTVTSGSPTVTGISAAEIIGVRVGQVAVQSFPSDARVTSVGASSFTCSKNAISSTAFWSTADVLEVSIMNTSLGYAFYTNGAYSMVTDLAGANGSLEITTSQPVGEFPVTSTVDIKNAIGLTLSIEPSRPEVTSFTLRASGGDKYSPPLPLTTATALTFSQTFTPNLLRWSKDSEPEHAPSVNETRVGSGKIVQLVSTKDALWIFCTDGIFRLSGDAGVWQINVIAPGCVICSPGCATSMRDQVYAYTNYGFVAVTDAGVVPISDLQIKTQLPGPPYLEGTTTNGFLVNNDDDEEVLIFTGFPASKFYLYNARANAFTYVQNAGTGMNNMTAAAFQQNPASGNAAVLLADTNTTPKYAAWGRGNALFLAPTVQYRALYAKNPMNVKHWVDMTLFFESGPSNNVFSVAALIGAGGNESTGIGFTVAGPVDNTLTVGIIRKYAIATSIQPGYATNAYFFQTAFEGLSLRVVELGVQQVRR